MRIAYVGNFTQSHCTENHISKTLEEMGHSVTRIQESPEYANSLIEVVKGHDLFLFTRTWNNLVTLEHLKQLKDLGIPTVSYHLDLYVGLQREAGLDDDPFWRTEFVFSPDGDPKSQDVFKSKGINHYYMRPGVFKQECIELEPNNDPELQGDVIFVGGGAEYGHKEWPYRHQLVRFLEDNWPGYRKYGHPQKTVRNMELNQLYANAKIVVGDSLCLNFNHPYYWSDRVCETIGRGGFIIHPWIKGMDEEFTDGENIVFYKFNDWEDLKKKINFYLENPEERKRIQHNGFEFVKENCTYNNRLQRMLDIVMAKDEWVDTEDGGRTNERLNVEMNEHFENEDRKDFIINLGAGTDVDNDYFNVDLVDLPGIDKVHNLGNYPWPFEDNEADGIRAIDVLEHLPNYTKDDKPGVIAFIEECHRILKPGGELYIQTPRYDAEFLWIDVSHIRGFHERSFDFFDPKTHYGTTTGFYSKCKFDVRSEVLQNKNLRFYLRKI